ncbi:PREDICTED: uncharacterized protein LOC109356330 [Lupinus angustifolius]|uniref:uncharacterized protein LOC109356330 n=1 Tax=Lupinus angustifolius TaxID=3871 RepID=UPI00092F9111|nr:PREDICTED: uncharacterized protein LOC109356330 [Lupinus angustifolius]
MTSTSSSSSIPLSLLSATLTFDIKTQQEDHVFFPLQMAQKTGNFAITLPILDNKNWTRWCIQMKAILGYQDVADIMEEGLPILEEGATEAQRNAHKQNKKRDCKAICLLHQIVDNAHFEKIAGSATAKEAWDVLEKYYTGAAQLKKIHLQTMRTQYELMQMEEGEKVADFFIRLITHKNAMTACGEKMTDATIVEKILRAVSPKFDYVVIAIEESGIVENMKIEELQGSLEAHKQRLNERIKIDPHIKFFKCRHQRNEDFVQRIRVENKEDILI